MQKQGKTSILDIVSMVHSVLITFLALGILLAVTLPAGLLNLMQAQQSAAEYGPMYAGLVLVMLPVLILYICVQSNLTKGMTVGGLKG